MNSENKLFLCVALSTLSQISFAAAPAKAETKKAAEAAVASGALTPRSQRLYDKNKKNFPELSDAENRRRIPILREWEDLEAEKEDAKKTTDPKKFKEIYPRFVYHEIKLFDRLNDNQ